MKYQIKFYRKQKKENSLQNEALDIMFTLFMCATYHKLDNFSYFEVHLVVPNDRHLLQKLFHLF